MKAHEETWEIVDGTAIRAKGLRVARFTTEIRTPAQAARFDNSSTAGIVQANHERARLAAQAPEMARLLLRLETSPSSSHEFVSALQAIKYVLRDAGVLP